MVVLACQRIDLQPLGETCDACAPVALGGGAEEPAEAEWATTAATAAPAAADRAIPTVGPAVPVSAATDASAAAAAPLCEPSATGRDWTTCSRKQPSSIRSKTGTMDAEVSGTDLNAVEKQLVN